MSISSQVLPEYREYERTVTTLVDAFVKPHMDRYLRRVKDALGDKLGKKPFLVMQSNGGVLPAQAAAFIRARPALKVTRVVAVHLGARAMGATCRLCWRGLTPHWRFSDPPYLAYCWQLSRRRYVLMPMTITTTPRPIA